MTLTAVDVGLRGAAIALFLLLSAMFARDWRRSLTARLGAVLTLAGGCYVALVAIDSFGTWNPWRVPLHLLSLSAPPLFWLFAASWFDDEFDVKPFHWLYVAMAVIVGAGANYLFWVGHLRFFGLMYGWRVLSVVAVVLALRAMLVGRAADLVESRRRLRLALSSAVALVILWIVVGEIGGKGWPPSTSWRVGNAAGMLLLAIILATATLGWRDPMLVAAPTRPAPLPQPTPEADDSALLAHLETDMRHERLYRQEGLTVTAVAARLGVPEYRLRRAINQGLGARNFNAYLNGFRIDEARHALADPAQREVPILTIALDAGFGSLAPFNRAFREAEACTPTEYRARRLIEIAKPTD